MWTNDMNKYLMRCYYLCTKMEIDQSGRLEMMQMFNEKYERFANRLNVQRLMDRKRYLIRCGKLSSSELEDIKLQVQRELRRRSLNRSSISNRVSVRLSNIFANVDQISNENNPTILNVSQNEVTQNQENQLLLSNLGNHMDSAISEFYGTDPNLRNKIPKLRSSNKLIEIVSLMDNHIISRYVDECEDLEMLHYIVYCAAVATVRTMGIRMIPKTTNYSQDNFKPSWMRRLENRINKIRTNLGRLTSYRNGIRTPKLCRRVTNIIKPMDPRNLTSNNLDELIDMYTQKLSALSKRLKRYTECTERKKQNNNFQNNEKHFYNQMRNTRPNFADGFPDIKDVELFWSNIWEKTVLHDNENWLLEEEDKYSVLDIMEETTITIEEVKEVIKYTRNWSSPGPDYVQNFWFKKFSSVHHKMAECFNNALRNPRLIPQFMVQGSTFLIPKDLCTSNPEKYRPIICLPSLYKILTSIITKKIQNFCEIQNIIAEEQKGCKRNTKGCKDQLIIDSVVTGQALNKSRNLSMAYIDFKKAYDMVPHSYLVKILQIYRIDSIIIRFLENVMSRWNTTLVISDGKRVMKSRKINIRRGILQGDSFSPLWFCLALNPISNAINNTGWGYQIHHGVEKHTISHSLYMDDLKLYASSVSQLQGLLNLTKRISTNIKMEFGMDKCKSVQIHHGHLIKTTGFEMDEDRIIDLIEGETYKFLGFQQLKHLHHSDIKKKLEEEFCQRINQIFGSLLNSRNKMKAINTFAVPVLTYSFGIIKWSGTDLHALDTLIRTTMTRHRMHHRSSAVERVSLSRKEGGRGYIDITALCKSQIYKLREYFEIRKSHHNIYKAVCEADIGYSALHLADPEYVFLPDCLTEQEKINIWKRKELHGAHPYQLDSPHVDKTESNEWLKRGDLFGETEGFIIAIQDRVIATKNYRKYILHQDLVDDKCGKCGTNEETIEHIINGCRILSNSEYTTRHNNVAKIIHQSLGLKYNLLQKFLPYYKYTPNSILENQSYKIYWDHPIITDISIPANRPDILIFDKQNKTVQLIDIAVPLNHNLQSTFSEKISKYHNLAEEIKEMWNLNHIEIIPVVISSTGVVPKTLKSSMSKLEIPASDIYKIQKAVILATCNIVRRFLSQHNTSP